MKNYKYIKLGFLLVTLVLASCTDMLDETPLSTLTPTNLFETVEDAQAASTGMYQGLLNGPGGWGYLYPIYGWGIRGTDIWSSERGIQAKFSRYTLTPADDQIKNNWAASYRVINRANNILAFVDKIDASMEVINGFMADAYFVRAFYYMDLVQFYGGVPLRLEPTQSIEDALGSPRMSEEAVWAQIIEDLEYAEQHLPESAAPGKATKWAAKGLLAKAYLTRGGYPVGNYQETEWFDKAAKKAYEVISQSGKSLNSTTPGSDAAFLEYGRQFLVSGENSPESLFEIQFLEIDYGGGWGYRTIQGGNRWDITETGSYRAAWGGTVVGTDFALSFNDDDIRFQWSIGPFVLNNNGRKEKDFKLWAPYKHRWESIPGSAWGSSVNAIVLRMADVYLLFAEAANEATGDPNNSTYGMSAYDAINVVRERAQVPLMDDAYLMKDSPYGSQDMLYGQSFESFDKTNPNFDGRHVYYQGSLKERFASAVLLERGWELCFERHRWFDLKRTGKLVEFARNTIVADGGSLTADALVDPVDKSDFAPGKSPKFGNNLWTPNAIQEHNIYLPIPDVEIQINPELSQSDQNPGY